MAWPPSGRNLLRNIRFTARDRGATRASSWELWTPISPSCPSLTSTCYDGHDNCLHKIVTSEGCQSNALVNKKTTETFRCRDSEWESRIATGWHFSKPARHYLHYTAVASEPSVARASEAIASDFEDLNALLKKRIGGCSSEDDSLQTEELQTLFAGLTTREIASMIVNLQLVAFEPAVDLSTKVLLSQLMRWPVTSVPIFWLLKRTIYSHFCAGENVDEARVTLGRLRKLGLRSALDYGIEDAVDEESCDKNCEGFLRTIHMSTSVPDNSVSFVAVKISAICPVELLKRVSDHLRWQYKHPEYRLSWKHDSLPLLAPESPTYHTQQTPEPLSQEEEGTFLRAQQRLRKICESAAELNVPLLLDAEYVAIQPAIDYVAYAAAEEFNLDGRPTVYTTLQTYLRDASSRLSLALSEASRRGSFLAFKVVRGAYIIREKAEAAALGAESPIHADIEATHQCYNTCASVMLNQVASGTSAFTCATHNMHSGKLIAQRAEELGLSRTEPRLQFVQLKGMADSLSLALAHAGFNVSKWLTFGTVPTVIPFLVRRAEENRGLLGNNLADRQRLRKELWRRMRSASGLKLDA